MSTFVRPRDASGLVLHADPPGRLEAGACRQSRLVHEGRHVETSSVDRGDPFVERSDDRNVLLVRESASTTDVIRVEQLPVSDERVRVVSARESGDAETRDSLQDVVHVVAVARGRASERRGILRRDASAAAGAHQRRNGRPHQPAPATVRAVFA